jgi:hypothetical protein
VEWRVGKERRLKPPSQDKPGSLLLADLAVEQKLYYPLSLITVWGFDEAGTSPVQQANTRHDNLSFPIPLKTAILTEGLLMETEVLGS